MKKLAEKPFAIVGVNVSESTVESLKKVTDKEKLTWRSFADLPGQGNPGAIAKRWNVMGTPTLYILDHKRVIRHKWMGGERAIDEVLDKLIKEAEAGQKEP